MTDINRMLTDIARQHLGISTLDTRRSDSLDFHDVAVWSVAGALKSAFEAGATAAACSTGSLESNLVRKMLTTLQTASNYMADDLDQDDETEMRVFRAIRTAIAEAMAACPPSDPIDDCEGETLSALVDVQGDEEYEQSRFIDFEDERLRKAAPELLAALKGTLYSLDENMDGSGPSKQTAIAIARALIAELDSILNAKEEVDHDMPDAA